MKDWFQSLEERERTLVATAAVMIVVGAFWFGIWTPLDEGQRSLTFRVDNWRTSLAELRPLKERMNANPDAQLGSADADQSLIVIVDSSLRQRDLNNALQRSQPTADGDGIRVEFNNVAFDDLVLWLGDVNRQFGLDLQSANFSQTTGDNPGRVNSSLVLQR